MEKEIYFGRAYQMNLVSERKKSFFFLDILATIVDGCEAIKMKKSLIVIGFLLSSSKVYFVFRFLFFSTFPFFLFLCPRYFKRRKFWALRAQHSSSCTSQKDIFCMQNLKLLEFSAAYSKLWTGPLALSRGLEPCVRQ